MGEDVELHSAADQSHGELELTFANEPGLSDYDPDFYDNNDLSDSVTSVITLSLPEELRPEPVPEPLERKQSLRLVPAQDPTGHTKRARSAPPRPLTAIEELRGSRQFQALEAAAALGSQLVQRADGRLDLDSDEGQHACKGFLQELENLFHEFGALEVPRGYRGKFSQAYRVLYKGNELGYLIEILDSAQESTQLPH